MCIRDRFWADAYLGIGVVMDLQGKTEEAFPFIDKAITLEPKNPDYTLYKIEMLAKQEKYFDAQLLGEHLTKEFPDNDESWMALADIHYKQKQLIQALQVLEEATLFHVSNADLAMRRVVYLYECGKIQEAEQLMLMVLQNDKPDLEEFETYYPKIQQVHFYLQLKQDLGLV